MAKQNNAVPPKGAKTAAAKSASTTGAAKSASTTGAVAKTTGSNKPATATDKRIASLDRRAKAISAASQQQKKLQKSKEEKAKEKENKNFFQRAGAGFVRFGKAIAKKFREMRSELKKVTWPTHNTTFKSTLVVLSVVLVFLVVLFAMDLGLSELLKYLVTPK